MRQLSKKLLQTFSGLNAFKIRVIEAHLKYFCEVCSSGLFMVPKILKGMDDLAVELSLIKIKLDSTTPTERSNNLHIFNMPNSENDMKSVNHLFGKLGPDTISVYKTSRIDRGITIIIDVSRCNS